MVPRRHRCVLDADRFEGRPREGARKVDVSDLMRRLTKEELRKFDGAPLFPEREASKSEIGSVVKSRHALGR